MSVSTNKGKQDMKLPFVDVRVENFTRTVHVGESKYFIIRVIHTKDLEPRAPIVCKAVVGACGRLLTIRRTPSCFALSSPTRFAPNQSKARFDLSKGIFWNLTNTTDEKCSLSGH